MNPNVSEQVINLIDKSQSILLLTHAKADCDGLGAMLAAHMVLRELGKDVTAVTSDPAPENLAFLPSVDIVQNSLASAKDFIITLDLSRTPLNKIKYNLEDNRVNIIITPKQGMFSDKDVSFAQGGGKFDLIIVFDTGNLEHLGMIYDQNTELFFETPVINIDHHTSNTDFGQINMVDFVAASTTEVLYYLMEAIEKKYDKKFITEDIATLLLAGIIADTGSFQHANTSPRSMETAAKLLDLGARQQEIIKNIYKTKKLSTLKLWGMVLSKVQVDPIYRMVWSTISKDDLQEAGAEADESEGIIDDLLSNAPGAEVIMLIKYNENGNYTSISMRSTTNQVDVGKLCADMGGGGHTRAAGYKIRDGRPFDQIISEVLANVRKYQKERLNIHATSDDRQGRPEEAEEVPRMREGAEPKSSIEEKGQQKPQEKPKQDADKPKKATYFDFKASQKKKQHKAGRPASAPTSATADKPANKPQNQPEKKNPEIRQEKLKPPVTQPNQNDPKPKQDAPKPRPDVRPENAEPRQQTAPPPPVSEASQETPSRDLGTAPKEETPPPNVPDWLKEE